MIRRSGVRPAVKRSKLARVMFRRAASGHIPATQLSKFAAASRIAVAVINGWPEAPSSPLHACGPPGVPWAGPLFEEPQKMLPRNSSELLLAVCARAGPHHAGVNAII